MATGLGQLLVEDGVVQPDRLEDAYQRQVLYGGQLDTVLLEMGLVEESLLLEAMSRRFKLPAADRVALAGVDPELAKRLPRRLAERYRIVPLKLDRRHLHVACCRPLPLDVLDDVGFTLSLYVVPHITIELRLNYALEQLYGIPMGARFDHLLAQLGEEVERVAEEARTTARVASVPASPADDEEVTAPAQDDEAADAGAQDSVPVTPQTEAAAAGPGWVVDEPGRVAVSGVEEPHARRDDPIESWHAVQANQAGIDMSDIRFERPAEAISSLLTGGTVEVDTGFFEQAPPRLVERLQAEDEAAAQRELLRHHRVSWSHEDASAELALAHSRDDVVEVLLRFAHRRLDRVAVFVLLDEAFIGWDAIGGDLEGRVTQLRLPLEASPSLHLVRRTGAHSLGPIPSGDALLKALGGAAPRAVVIVPFFVRERLLGVLVGDCGETAINPAVLTDLQMLMPQVRLALEVVILRRKRALQSGTADLELDAGSASPVAAHAESASPEVTAAPVRVDPAVVPSSREAEVDPPSPVDTRPDPSPVEPAGSPRDPGAEPAVQESIGVEPATVEAAAATLPPQPLADQMEQPPAPATVAAAVPLVLDDARLEQALVDEVAALELAAVLHHSPISPGIQDQIDLAEAHEENELPRREALRRIAALRGAALPALFKAFPGKLRLNLFGNFDRRPEAASLSAVCEALVRLGPAAAAPIVVEALGRRDRVVRIAAVVLLNELHIPSANARLCQCLLDVEARIAFTAAEVCTRRGCHSLPDWAAAHIDQALRSGDLEQIQRAVRASRACFDRGAIHRLIELLDKGPKDLMDEVADALREISKHDFGLSAGKWRSWFQAHGHERRVEWLLAGLAHKDKSLRQSAQYELSALSGELFGYYFDSPKGEREAALARWRAWWEHARQRDDLP
ncbi:MAG: hypothetical protein ABIJ09_10650 [Pseudomonadota bacterium]